MSDITSVELYPSQSHHWRKVEKGAKPNCVLILDVTPPVYEDGKLMAVAQDLEQARIIARALAPDAIITE